MTTIMEVSSGGGGQVVNVQAFVLNDPILLTKKSFTWFIVRKYFKYKSALTN